MYDVNLFSQLFPREVGSMLIPLPDRPLPLSSVEERSVINAVPKRRIEFSAGRHCAHVAMAKIGYGVHPIPSGPDRAPIWPPGLTGSITHSDGFCGAVVATITNFQSVGIDMEATNAVPTELANYILRPDDIIEIGQHNFPEDVDRLTLCFCLKEAVYKAFYPRFGQVIGFQEVSLRINMQERLFIARAHTLHPLSVSTWEGRFIVQHQRIFAGCW